jgi:hypothetical protein
MVIEAFISSNTTLGQPKLLCKSRYWRSLYESMSQRSKPSQRSSQRVWVRNLGFGDDFVRLSPIWKHEYEAQRPEWAFVNLQYTRTILEAVWADLRLYSGDGVGFFAWPSWPFAITRKSIGLSSWTSEKSLTGLNLRCFRRMGPLSAVKLVTWKSMSKMYDLNLIYSWRW